MSKQDAQLAKWAKSLDLFAAGLDAAAKKVGELNREIDRLQRNMEDMRKKGNTVCRAYLGIRAERDRLLAQKKDLEEKNLLLEQERDDLQNTVDFLAEEARKWRKEHGNEN